MTSLKNLLTANRYEIRNTLNRHYAGIPSEAGTMYVIFDETPTRPKPLICAHIDTHNIIPPAAEDIQQKNGIVGLTKNARLSLDCLGADDRAGIWIAMELYTLQCHGQTNTSYAFAFFDGEESGGIGSNYIPARLIEDYTCFVAVDRAISKTGENHIATYGYNNDDLTEIITSQTGLKTMRGSFTDVKNLSRKAKKACLNFSIGYQSQHTRSETLNLSKMQETLTTLASLKIPTKNYPAEEVKTWTGYTRLPAGTLKTYQPIKTYQPVRKPIKAKPQPALDSIGIDYAADAMMYPLECTCCHNTDRQLVTTPDGFTYCPDCLDVETCDSCGQTGDLFNAWDSYTLCRSCLEIR